MARVCATNAPWLILPPAEGTYEILRHTEDSGDELQGPFTIESELGSGWAKYSPNRLGSIIWTPMHMLARNSKVCSLSWIGETTYNGLSVVEVAGTFTSPYADMSFGLGGQTHTSYSHSSCHQLTSVHFLIETNQAIPIYMTASWEDDNMLAPTWEFDPHYLTAAGGLAPSSVYCVSPGNFSERQQFQVVNGLWFFQQGEAWWAEGQPWSGSIQTLVMTHLTLVPKVSLGARQTTTGLELSLPPGLESGFHLESAPSASGPWLEVTNLCLATNATLNINMAGQAAQFYRLRK